MKPVEESTYWLAATWLYHNDYVYFHRDLKVREDIRWRLFYDDLSTVQQGLVRVMTDQILQNEREK